MSKVYQLSEKYFVPSDNSVLVEIGSDRYEGSTAYFDNLATQHNTRLISVDVDERIGLRLPASVEFVVDPGSEWANNFAKYNKTIACLYLDNFDWYWGAGTDLVQLQEQRLAYKNRGVELNNHNSQLEHLSQMISLLPFMSDRGLVVCDDTYTVNEAYTGKCGAVVPFLIVNGYSILEKTPHGIVLGKLN